MGLILSFFTYWGLCYYHPPAVHFSLKQWMEPKDYVREEERLPVLEGTSPTDARSEDMDEETKVAGRVSITAVEK